MDKINVYFDTKKIERFEDGILHQWVDLNNIFITDGKHTDDYIVIEKDADGFFNINLPEYIDIIECKESTIFTNVIRNYSKIENLSIRLILNKKCKEIGNNPFYYDRFIKEVVCNSNLALIGFNAFRGSSLEKITFPEDCVLTYLNDYCFESSKLKSFIAPKNLKTISSNAFANSSINNIDFSNAQNLRKIAQRAFFNTEINKIHFHSNLSKIGSCAFAQCEKLESVIFDKNSNIKKIAKYAFYQCCNLSNFYLNYKSNKLLSLGESVFEGCQSLKKIDGFDTWNFIKLPNRFFAYSDMSELYSLPISVKYLGDLAFAYSQAENLKLADVIISIGDGCFYKVQFKNKDFNYFISSCVKSIGNSAFANCNFEKINTYFFQHLEKLGSFAFACNNFKNLVIYPLSSKIKNSYVFYMNEKLTDIEFKNSYKNEYTVRNSMFCRCCSLKTIKLSDTIKTIEKSAFCYCGTIEKFIANTNLEVIEKKALKKTKIENLDLSLTKVISFPSEVFSENSLQQTKINYFTSFIKSNAFLNLREEELKLYPFVL